MLMNLKKLNANAAKGARDANICDFYGVCAACVKCFQPNQLPLNHDIPGVIVFLRQ